MTRRKHLQAELRERLTNIRRALFSVAGQEDPIERTARALFALADVDAIARLCAPAETEDEQLGPRCWADNCTAPGEHRTASEEWLCVRHALAESIAHARAAKRRKAEAEVSQFERFAAGVGRGEQHDAAARAAGGTGRPR